MEDHDTRLDKGKSRAGRKIALFASLATMILGVLLVLAACNANAAEVDRLKADNLKLTTANQQLKDLAGPPPSSLDSLYPPKAPAPLYLVEMFNLATPMDGMGGALQAQNMAGVKSSYQAFVTEYNKVSQMVPEWTKLFPKDPVDSLGQAINGGDPSKIGPAMAKIGQVCSDCHLLNQAKVMQQYHFGNFDAVKTTDPLSNKELAFGDYMTAMAGTFEGALTSLGTGNQAAAVKTWADFTTEYKALADNACKQCHSDPVTKQEIPRKYFVDADSMAILGQMGKALAASPPDATAVGNLSTAIGNGICFNCHLIHLPAQQAKDKWQTYSALFK